MLAIGVGLTGGAPSARAVLVEATFSGEVTHLDSALQIAGAPYDQIQLGDPFTLTYRFDSETPNLLPGGMIGDASGRYQLLKLETSIGPFHSSTTPSGGGLGLISVRDASSVDSYRVGAELPDTLVGFELVALAFLEDSTATAFSDATLPLDLDLTDFDSSALQLSQAGSFIPPAEPRLFVEASVLGFQARVVPEPAAVWLAIGCGAVFLSRGCGKAACQGRART